MLDPIEVFISYADEDSELRRELETHLAVLERDGTITIWSDWAIDGGTEWAPETRRRLSGAHVILLLVSSNFVASRWCYEEEMRDALGRHDKGTAVVIPIIIRECHWEAAPFAKLQVLPRDRKAVTARGPKKHEVWRDIAKEVHEVALRARRRVTPVSLPPETEAATPEDTSPAYASADPFQIVRSAKDPLTVVPGGEAQAVRMIRESSVSQPSREVAVVPLAMHPNFLKGDLDFLAAYWQVQRPHEGSIFPNFDLRNSATRLARGVRWSSDIGRIHERRFALADDGSFAASEFASESISYDATGRLRCINIFPCLDLYLGALLFTRQVAAHCELLRQAWIILTLRLIEGEHLVYDDSRGYSTDPAADQFVARDKLIRVGGFFETSINEHDLVDFIAGMTLAVSARFGCDHRRGELAAYVEHHLPKLLAARLERRSR